ncbi:MAG: tRNA pseudouridine(13) synthase TruD [Deltaproteobacteria bacterium]|nr:MAG: tRNA pseudouridine(13) synthase TruD [Deltaproteobacteria bacterium]
MSNYLTARLPGTGGTLRQEPEDFCVEEIPLYTPCGEGEHLYVTVEKRGLTTFDLLRQLARALRCPEREIGYAGLKDSRAVTRQTVSVPLRRPADVLGLELPGVRILEARLHRNKLRLGHLAGNRFRIRIHRPDPGALARAEAILDVLQALGVPNRFGDQRYGVLGNSHRIGRAILGGDYAGAIREIIGDPAEIRHPEWQAAAIAFRDGKPEEALARLPRHCHPERQLLEALRSGRPPREAVFALPRKLLRLYLSACQSSLFDRLVDMRLNSLERLWPGDLAMKHVNGACFEVVDPAAEQPRADTFEISPTAPLYGCKVRLAGGQAGLLERSLLDKERLTLEGFRLPGGLAMEGERRPLRVPLLEVTAAAEGDDLLLGFRLPKGSYATAVLHEVMKTSAASSELADVTD